MAKWRMVALVGAFSIAAPVTFSCGGGGSASSPVVEQTTTTVKPGDQYLAIADPIVRRLEEGKIERGIAKLGAIVILKGLNKNPAIDLSKITTAFEVEQLAYRDFSAALLAQAWPSNINVAVVNVATASTELSQNLGALGSSLRFGIDLGIDQQVAEAEGKLRATLTTLRTLLGLPATGFVL